MEKTTKQLIVTLLALAGSIASAGAQEPPSSEVDGDAIPELDCVIEPSEIVDVGSAVPGVVESIHARRSDLVKKGAVVAKLESSVERATLKLAKIRAQLNTAIELRQESARFGHLTQQRNQSLMETSAISQQEMDQVKTETRIAELQVRQEQDNQHIAGLEYQRSQAVLQRRTIRSPVEGVVMARFKSVGEYVEDEPVLRVAQLDPLHVEVIVPVDYLGRIVPGMQAQVTPVVKGSASYLATVERVDRVADAASGTYGVRLSLANPHYTIPAGLRCRLGFVPQQSQEPAEIAGGMNTTHADEAMMGTNPESPQLPDSPTARSESAPAALAVTDLPTACYTIGPISDEALVSQLSERLQDASNTLLLRQESVGTKTRYNVLAASEPDRQATKALIGRLKSAGITDRFLLWRGDHRGRVSLGLYYNRRTALKRQQRLADQGFEAEIVSYQTQSIQHWLDVAAAAEIHLSSRMAEITTALPPSASVRPTSCQPQLAHR